MWGSVQSCVQPYECGVVCSRCQPQAAWVWGSVQPPAAPGSVAHRDCRELVCPTVGSCLGTTQSLVSSHYSATLHAIHYTTAASGPHSHYWRNTAAQYYMHCITLHYTLHTLCYTHSTTAQHCMRLITVYSTAIQALYVIQYCETLRALPCAAVWKKVIRKEFELWSRLIIGCFCN